MFPSRSSSTHHRSKSTYTYCQFLFHSPIGTTLKHIFKQETKKKKKKKEITYRRWRKKTMQGRQWRWHRRRKVCEATCASRSKWANKVEQGFVPSQWCFFHDRVSCKWMNVDRVGGVKWQHQTNWLDRVIYFFWLDPVILKSNRP